MHDDRTVEHLDAALPDDATIVTVGWPEVVGQAIARRGDIRVLAVDADHQGTSFVQRLERADVDCELLPAEAAALAASRADLVIIEADAVDATRIVAPLGSAVLAAVAGVAATPLWLVAGCGRRLPSTLLDGMIARIAADDEDAFDVEVEVLPTASVTHVVGPRGRSLMSPDAVAAECDVAPELLRASPI
jgi:translation initiation factor 2B subunit (eIF-2B alpha/beta/delta family)